MAAGMTREQAAVAADQAWIDSQMLGRTEQTPRTLTLEVWYTTAPAEYDSGDTLTLEPFGACPKSGPSGQELRAVGIVPASSQWQRDRYASGFYGCYTDEEVL